ncbi:hypothetical protein LL261_001819, partial [Proteus mirabilis]
MIFSTSIEENHLMEKEKEYKKQLNKLINEIRKNLQSMSLGELVYAKLLDYELNNKMNSYSYHIEKFSEWLICNNNNDILNNCLEKMNEMSGNEYIFSIQDSKDRYY